MNRPASIAILALTVILAGAPARSGADQAATITGTIGNPTGDPVVVGDIAATPDSAGNFALHVALTDPTYLTLDCGATVQLLLAPGDSLDMTANRSDILGTLRFTGPAAPVNAYLADAARRDADIRRSLSWFERTLYSYGEGDFLHAMDSLRGLGERPLEEFLAEHDVHPMFAKRERARILYSWAEGVRIYPGYHEYLTGIPRESLSEGFDDYLAHLDLDDAAVLEIEEYSTFVTNHVDDLARTLLRNDPDSTPKDNWLTHGRFRIADELFTDPTVRCHWLSRFIKSQLDDHGTKGADSLLAEYRGRCPDDASAAALDSLYAAERAAAGASHDTFVYKVVDGVTLDAHVFRPEDLQPGERRPAIVIFHGAAWQYGTPEWCFGMCRNWAERGMVAVAAQYRVMDRHGTTPFESMLDARSVIRWMRTEADEFGIEPERIAAAGWSAGGHIATAAAMIDRFDDPRDDTTVSAAPNALVLYYSVVKLQPNGFFDRMTHDSVHVEDCSPWHHIRPNLPPTIIFHGTADRAAPFGSAADFAQQMTEAGNRCEFHAFEERPHLFLRSNPDDRVEVGRLTVEFFKSLGYIDLQD